MAKQLTEAEKAQAFDYLNRYAGMRMTQIQAQCENYGLRTITNFTLIARDPNNDDMCLVVTNDDLQKAVQVALQNASIPVA